MSFFALLKSVLIFIFTGDDDYDEEMKINEEILIMLIFKKIKK